MRYLSLPEILDLHSRILYNTPGSAGIRDLGILESALAQPRATFGGQDLYPDIISKASILCYSLVMNHPFIDGNKRIGHAAMVVFLNLNGYEIEASEDEQYAIIMELAASKLDKDSLKNWVEKNITKTN